LIAHNGKCYGMNKLILGDNLEIMRRMESETIDLIYLDPPFFSNRNYEVLWGDEGEIRSFVDRWSGGIEHYIGWLKERVAEMHRLLKPTGSIFLHCDWHADAYIRVHILDKIFGEQNFRNKITWKRTDTHNDAKKQLPNVCDDIFYYSKSDKYVFNVQYGKHAEKTLKEWYLYLEFEDGTIRKMTKEEKETQTIPVNSRRFNADNMSNPSRVWVKGLYDYKGYNPPNNGWRFSLETMQELDNQNLLLFPKEKSGRIMRKRYLDEQKGAVIGDFWADIDQIRAAHSERIGYPTQKPEKLLERIISMSSKDGDLIFDPFVGGGTTIAVAEKLNRKWIGIDQSVQAVKVTEFRINILQNKDIYEKGNLFAQPFVVQLYKYDYDELFNRNPMQFESWIIEQFGGIPNIKQKSDLGIDGKTRENIPIQVKQSENIGRNVIDNFNSAIKRFDKNLYDNNIQNNKIAGYVIAFSFGKGAIQEVARLKNDENVIVQLVRVDEIVPISVKPKLTVEIVDNGQTDKHLREIYFVATGETTEGKHIEFYAWDFNYNDKQFSAEILRDTQGKQTKTFKAGEYKIAVKVIDNEGLENTEIIKLKVNGKIEKL